MQLLRLLASTALGLGWGIQPLLMALRSLKPQGAAKTNPQKWSKKKIYIGSHVAKSKEGNDILAAALMETVNIPVVDI